jgi:hypothetical protein
MPYTDQKEYRKFLKGKCSEHEHSHDSGCNDCHDCNGCDDKEKCTCCPVGLVAVYDDEGRHKACVTPEDAELMYTNTFVCSDGYVKLFKEGTPSEFLGCVPSNEFAALYAAVNPSA